MKNRIFIIGILYGINDKNKEYIEALSLYDRDKKKGYIQSMNKVTQRFINGEPIVGMRVRSIIAYSYKTQNYKLVIRPLLSRTYDYKQLSIIDCSGKVLKQGKDVIIGMKKIGDTEKCVVINNNYEERIIDKEEAIQNRLLGVYKDTFYRPSMELID
ncbi:MAG: hypothetical protein HDR05_12480 [Lachnospiraceae bacterium]|nr:hypothetical protein [Lachnospiraceae bacterium]